MNLGLSSSTPGTPLLDGRQSTPAPVLATPVATVQAAS